MVPPSVLVGVVTPPLLAHQGGWDEILMVAVPVGLFAFLLYAANKRAARLAEERGDDPENQEADVASIDHEPDGAGGPAPGRPPRPRGPI